MARCNSYIVMPVRIRGKVYPSAQVAADHFGVKRNTIYAAITMGTLDRVGMPRNNVKGRPGKKIKIAGRKFNSARDCDRFIGERLGYTYKVITHGGEVAKKRLEQKVLKAIKEQAK